MEGGGRGGSCCCEVHRGASRSGHQAATARLTDHQGCVGCQSSRSCMPAAKAGEQPPQAHRTPPPAPPAASRAWRCWRKARKGATPVPGPTMTSGTEVSLGIRSAPRSHQTGTRMSAAGVSACCCGLPVLVALVPAPAGSRPASQDVHTPRRRRLNGVVHSTIATAEDRQAGRGVKQHRVGAWCLFNDAHRR